MMNHDKSLYGRFSSRCFVVRDEVNMVWVGKGWAPGGAWLLRHYVLIGAPILITLYK